MASPASDKNDGAGSESSGGIKAMLPHVDSFRPIHNLAAMTDLCTALSRDAGRESDPRQWLAAEHLVSVDV